MKSLENDKDILIDVRNVDMQYPGQNQTDALSNINLQIEKGEFVCALGPSGCGKSTLLNIISGLLKPTAGEVLMHNKPISGVDSSRAVMFQTPTLYPWLSTYNNVAFGPKMRGLPADEIKEITNKYLSLVGLTEFSGSMPYELSGGMKQRASLARVLVNSPEMILMDEPLGALDAFTRKNMQNLIRSMWKESSKTFFFITHDVDEALLLGTKIVVISQRPGRIILEKDIDFTNRLFNDENVSEDDITYSLEYRTLRKDILSLINS